jgi:hypothetical protein
MHLQRYVSPDLTHFVGKRFRTQAERYNLLKRILKTGVLKASPRLKPARPLTRAILKDTDLGISTNQGCVLPAVCFCDIPLCDLPLHMRKYSPFGLAFEKSFLASVGAVPVVYVPARGRPASLPYPGYGRQRVASQAVCFDEVWRIVDRLDNRLDASPVQPRKSQEAQLLAEDTRRVIEFLYFHIFSNLKFFDHRLNDADRRNFYLEREWRVGQDVHFELDDVMRVIIPDRWHRQFRRDFDGYEGEVVFSDWQH